MKVTIDKIPPGPELDALVAEKVMAWKDVHRHDPSQLGNDDRYVGKKQDKLGRWRLTNVPPYSTEPTESSAIESRMKELGLSQKYLNELGKITHAKGIPAGWAKPDQRCRAALKAIRAPLRLVRRPGNARKAATIRKQKNR